MICQLDQKDFDQRMRKEIQRYGSGGRTDSASFLIWYLHNFFRLEEEDAISAVCDSPNDKGIDGILVDEDEEEVHLFQAKFSPDLERDQGDNDLRNFIGAKQWFASETTIESLLNSTASEELKALVRATNVFDHLSSNYPVYTHFVTNKVFDDNATEFLKINSGGLIGHDFPDIFKEYTYIADTDTKTGSTSLQLTNTTKIQYDLPGGMITRVYAIPAKELMKLNGIQDKTLFYRNVRYGLGTTRVNKEIKKTIKDESKHDKFFLFHNGITLVCDKLEEHGNSVELKNYSVINGCQSMLTLYENRDKITDSMHLLAKVIQLDQTSDLVGDITYYTNNQNPIRLQDLKADDRVHKAIQSQFTQLLDKQVLYKRKRGESEEGYATVIALDVAAQLIEAFYLGNPQNTHSKARLFGERYPSIFSRHTTAAKIYLAHLIYNVIYENESRPRNPQVQTYGLAYFFFLHVIAEILREDGLGKELVNDPAQWVKDQTPRLLEAVSKLWQLLVPDIDAYFDEYTKEHENFFDYKNVFKSTDFVDSATKRLLADNRKDLVRHPEDAFRRIYESLVPRT
jgi:hypothetical protein